MGRPSDPVPRDKCRGIILTFMIATSCLGTEAVTITGVQHSEISLSNHCRGSSAAAHCDPRSRITAQPRRTRECSVHHRSLHGSPLPHRPFALSDVVPSLCHQTANLTVCSPRPRSTRTSRFATAACSAFAPTARAGARARAARRARRRAPPGVCCSASGQYGRKAAGGGKRHTWCRRRRAGTRPAPGGCSRPWTPTSSPAGAREKGGRAVGGRTNEDSGDVLVDDDLCWRRVCRWLRLRFWFRCRRRLRCRRRRRSGWS
jgi:hypothetical protein